MVGGRKRVFRDCGDEVVREDGEMKPEGGGRVRAQSTLLAVLRHLNFIL